MSCTSLGVPVSRSALSTGVSFPLMIAVEGSTLGFPKRLSGTSSSWSSSNSSSRLGRNIPPEARSLKYNGSLKCAMFFDKFRTLARYYGWNVDECQLALSVSVEGPALRYFHILLTRRERMSFGEIASRFKSTLPTPSQVEFSSMTQEADDNLEHWTDRVIETTEMRVGTLLIDSPPLSLYETVRFVKI